jgi:hypothetical protein
VSTITVDRAVLEQALEALEQCGLDDSHRSYEKESAAKAALHAALAQQGQEPVAWTDRELELIDGMIEVQLRHAAQCDDIANRPMAERQKGWDMERVALLRKIKSRPPRREWRSLTNEEIYPLYNEPRSDAEILEFARAFEAALKEKNQ